MSRHYASGLVKCVLLMFFIFISLIFLIGSDSGSSKNSPHKINYGIVIDAGSTGSRLFLYFWSQSISKHQLIRVRPVLAADNLPVVKKISPGLSSFAQIPQNASAYMFPLLKLAAEYVPFIKQKTTPVFILATAGMRLIEKSEQALIIENLRSELPKHFNFKFEDENIQVISGKWEGIYSWIAINYILGRFDSIKYNNRPKTVGIIDMGGASVQIAFELTQSIGNEYSNLTEKINLGSSDEDMRHAYEIYVTTFLGFGVNEAMKRYEHVLSDTINDNQSIIFDPCLPVNLVKSVDREDGSNFSRKGIGDWNSCLSALQPLLTSKKCSLPPCYFAGVHRPEIDELNSAEVYGFSEFWYSLHDVLSLGGLYDYEQTASKARIFCATQWSIVRTRLYNKFYPNANEDRVNTQCFKSAWIISVLHEGFRLSKSSRRFRTAFTINGQEVQWTLGAILYHMRHSILRDLNQQSALFLPPYRLLLFLSLLCILVLFFRYFSIAGRKRNRLSSIPRNDSIWGYMMLTQDENKSYPSSVRVEKSGFVY